MANQKVVVGLFKSQQDAQQAVQALKQAGFGKGVTLVDQYNAQLAQRLTQAGVPEQDARLYAQGIQDNHPLVIVQGLDTNSAPTVADVLDRHHLIDITQRHSQYDHSQTTRDTSRTGQTNLHQGGEMTIPIIEEQISVGKREVEHGGVRVETHITEQPVNEQVTLRHEKVEVERHAVDRPASERDINQVREGTIEVEARAEEAVVSKQARVVEEVVINKTQHEHNQTIQDTVRRTDVDVENLPQQSREMGSSTVQSSSTRSGSGDEGMIERGLSKAENAVERGTGVDLDRDGDVGKRDPRNNI